MFTDIESYLLEQSEEYNFFYTDLNDFCEDGKDTFLKPLSEQAEILGRVIKDNMSNLNENIIIAHSQWCIVTALLKPDNISKIVFLAPPTNNDIDKTIKNFETRPGTDINKQGVSILMRSDGNKTFVPAKYWKERQQYHYENLYRDLKDTSRVSVIFAAQDELIKNDALESIKWYEIQTIDGNHNFDGESRKTLVKYIWKLLN